MKNLFFLTAFAAMSFSLISCDKGYYRDQPIETNELPSSAISTIDDFFSLCEVLYAERDRDVNGISYDVKLDCQVDLEFDKNGDWTDIDCSPNQVPDGIIPDSILNYVKTKYPKYFIVKIERDSRVYDVELNVDLDLVFNLKGEFLRIDD